MTKATHNKVNFWTLRLRHPKTDHSTCVTKWAIAATETHESGNCQADASELLKGFTYNRNLSVYHPPAFVSWYLPTTRPTPGPVNKRGDVAVSKEVVLSNCGTYTSRCKRNKDCRRLKELYCRRCTSRRLPRKTVQTVGVLCSFLDVYRCNRRAVRSCLKESCWKISTPRLASRGDYTENMDIDV